MARARGPVLFKFRLYADNAEARNRSKGTRMRDLSTRRRKDPVHTITTLPRRPLGSGARRPRRLFSPRSHFAFSIGVVASRWKAVLICFGAAALILAAAFSLPLAASTQAAADIDAASRASIEAAQLQNGAGKLF